MIHYLIHSSLCLISLLLVYHLFLERERMHSFNRIYLLVSLIFSLLVPFIPVGISGGLTGWMMAEPLLRVPSSVSGPSMGSASATLSEENAGLFPLFVLLYSSIVLLLLIRFLVNVDSILCKARRHSRIPCDNTEIVLLKERVTPFSFFRYIFVSEQRYRDGRIDPRVMIHEMAHVRQKHTLDILFIEALKTIFWFNPVFYFYKHAIQLNHEFLADCDVISRTGYTADYQNLLLKTMHNQQPVLLTSHFSYSMMKKRLRMITRKPTPFRSVIKKIAVLPVITGAALLFGCEIAGDRLSTDYPQTNQTIKIEISDSELIRVDGETKHVSRLDDHLAGLSNPSEMTAELKVMPDAYFGVIRDAQMSLRKNKLLRINYLTIER
ncbi:MAG: M56 family metallopeptidase [Balneolaceae bacterium]